MREWDGRATRAALIAARDTLRAIAAPASPRLTEAQLREVVRAQAAAARQALRAVEAALRQEDDR